MITTSSISRLTFAMNLSFCLLKDASTSKRLIHSKNRLPQSPKKTYLVFQTVLEASSIVL
ncbi:MAG: hypothetical protein ACFFC7_11940 [Candidatus Hermodarchaeota archaeon]